MSAPKFNEYGTWLKSPEYAAQMKRLLGEPATPPRQDWPVDVGALIAQHEAHATMCLEAAARHMRAANALAALAPPRIPEE
jgi:hypothetical protein